MRTFEILNVTVALPGAILAMKQLLSWRAAARASPRAREFEVELSVRVRLRRRR